MGRLIDSSEDQSVLRVHFGRSTYIAETKTETKNQNQD